MYCAQMKPHVKVTAAGRDVLQPRQAGTLLS
jgi:hypothetical protein